MPSPITTIVPRLECDDLPGVASIAQISEVHELDFVHHREPSYYNQTQVRYRASKD
jgi:hypothetical protein